MIKTLVKISSIIALALALSESARAMIVPDETLGNERSQIVPLDNQGLPVDLLQGGASRGANLFHSFLRFNVGEGRGAYFERFNDTQNILVRVTGREPSQILGTLGIVPLPGNVTKPSLFLMNPNGIVFGSNASLDLPGSFFATTANAIKLGNAGLFSAAEPEKSNLLAVEPSAFLFSVIANQAGIEVRSQAAATVLGSLTFGLQVPNGESLLLLGGTVNIHGGQLNAWGGRIEVGAVAQQGMIGLNTDRSLGIPTTVSRADIELQNGASADVRLDKGGTMTMKANQITVSGSDLRSGIAAGFGSPESLAGNLVLDATDEVRVEQQSIITNDIDANAIGNGGNIVIKATALRLTDASQIRARSEGQGNGGNIQIVTDQINVRDGSYISVSTSTGQGGTLQVNAADTIVLSGTNAIPGQPPSSFLAQNFGFANGGSIQVQTKRLVVQDGAGISTATFSEGTGGDLTINAAESVDLIGIASNASLLPSLLSTLTTGILSKTPSGKGGNLSLQTGQLTIRDGASIQASTDAEGQAGRIEINATAINLIGQSDRVFTGIQAKSERLFIIDPERRIGSAGSINMRTSDLFVEGGAGITTSTETRGKAGEIAIQADRITLKGGFIDASTAEVGDAGNLVIHASNEINLKKGSYIGSSTISSGNSGNLDISANRLTVAEGAFITTAALSGSTGRGGNLSVRARESVSILGTDSSGQFSSGISSETQGTGKAGILTLNTRELLVNDGGAISTKTSNLGQGGSLVIDATESINVTGGSFSRGFSSSITSQTEGTGNAGDLSVKTGRLAVRNGGFIATRARRGSTGNAGNLSVFASDAIEVSGTAVNGAVSAITTEVEVGGQGRSGDLLVKADQLNVEGGGLFSRSFGVGQAGSLSVDVTNTLFMNNGDISSLSLQSSGGAISVIARKIRLENNSNIFALVLSGIGGGGDITLTADSILALSDSNLLSFAQDGRGGNITLNTRAFLGQNYRPLQPGSDPVGNNQVDINASGAVSGVISLPDTTFIQNSLNPLPQSAIDTNTLLANSCIVRNQQNGSFYITGRSGLPTNPSELSTYSTGTVQPASASAWKPGDAIVEPQGVYQLPNGSLILSRECN